jgi:hypothetical protein
MRAGTLAIVAALAGGVAGLASAAPTLDAARARWRQADLASYEYGYRKFCECHRDAPPETVVSVRDGKVVNVRHRPVGFTTEVPAAEKNFEYYWTVDGLFELLQSAFDRQVEVRAEYDAKLGFPIRIHIDYEKSSISDDLDLEITGVTPLPR